MKIERKIRVSQEGFKEDTKMVNSEFLYFKKFRGTMVPNPYHHDIDLGKKGARIKSKGEHE